MKRLALAVAALPLPAFAHAGDHGHVGILHLLTEADHAAILGLAVVFAAAAYGVAKWRTRR